MTVAEIIAKWPSDAAFAADLGITHGALRVWRHRNTIPLKRVMDVVSAAKARRIRGIDPASLLLLSSQKQA